MRAPGNSGPSLPERNIDSPPTLEEPMPAPWNASQKLNVLYRPVKARASFIATSIASLPPVVKSTWPCCR